MYTLEENEYFLKSQSETWWIYFVNMFADSCSIKTIKFEVNQNREKYEFCRILKWLETRPKIRVDSK
jgi:N-glycosylase/DNA lyase